jgi:hypothetical protein
MRKFKLEIEAQVPPPNDPVRVVLDAEDLRIIASALRARRETARPWELPAIDRTLDCIHDVLRVR